MTTLIDTIEAAWEQRDTLAGDTSAFRAMSRTDTLEGLSRRVEGPFELAWEDSLTGRRSKQLAHALTQASPGIG